MDGRAIATRRASKGTLGKANLARLKLQSKGFTAVPNGLPKWEVFDFVESLHHRYCKNVVDILESLRDEWLDGDGSSERPGSKVAWTATERLASEGVKGIMIVATHPSVCQQSWKRTGPRFYVSVVEAVMAEFGECCGDELVASLPSPPTSLSKLLWPREPDQEQPRATELGWTVVPPGSDPQQLHADITSGKDVDKDPRRRGRFHHIVWKLDRAMCCTTQIVPEAFTDGFACTADYGRLRQVNANSILVDSEVLHRGYRTGLSGWSTSCTVQFCSSSGWEPLKERISEELAWYTCPIQAPSIATFEIPGSATTSGPLQRNKVGQRCAGPGSDLAILESNLNVDIRDDGNLIRSSNEATSDPPHEAFETIDVKADVHPVKRARMQPVAVVGEDPQA